MTEALLAVLLALPAAAADKAAPPSDDAKLVDYFVKTPTGELDPKLIPHFMELDLSKLDEQRRSGAQAKRLELNMLRKVSQSTTKPPIRRAGQDPLNTCDVQEGDSAFARYLMSMGFERITEDEEKKLEEKTKCTECELTEEFTLTRVIVKAEPKKKKPAEKLLLLHAKDPLMAIVSQYRDGHGNGTNFFSSGFFGACR